jgi:hypothetical protein
MFAYEFLVSTPKEGEMASFDTLLYPFDIYIWSFIMTLILLQISLMLMVEHLWLKTTNVHSSQIYIFESMFLITSYVKMNIELLISGIATSTVVLIQESLPHEWFRRNSFVAQKVLLFQWLIMGCLLSMAYRSILLSTLIPIRYEKPIDTLADLEKSGLPLLLPGKTSVNALVASDPRPIMNRIFNKSIVYPFDGTTPEWVKNM